MQAGQDIPYSETTCKYSVNTGFLHLNSSVLMQKFKKSAPHFFILDLNSIHTKFQLSTIFRSFKLLLNICKWKVSKKKFPGQSAML